MIGRTRPTIQPGQRVIAPQPGPQHDFLSSRADIVVFGGAAGGGKSFALLLDPLRGIADPYYTGVIFRREMPRITAPGGLKDEAIDLWQATGADCTSSPSIVFKWDSGAKIQMSHLQLEKDKLNWKGAQLSWIGFDELTEFEESQFWYLMSRARNVQSRFRPRIRATTNPDGSSWVRKLLDWWIDPETGLAIPERSGVIRHITRQDDVIVWVNEDWRDEAGQPAMTFTFIPSSLDDNRILVDSDPGYRQRLLATGHVEGQKLLYGNWNITHKKGLFERHRIDPQGIYTHQVPDGLSWVRYWDLADTEPHERNPDPDWTAGALVAVHVDERGTQHLYIKDLVCERLSGSAKHTLIQTTSARDGHFVTQAIEQEGGASGSEVGHDYKTRILAGFRVIMDRPSGSKTMRASRWLGLAEQAHVHLVRDEDGRRGDWFDGLLSQLDTFPSGKRDRVDAISGGYAVCTAGRRPAIRKVVVGR